MSVLVEDTARNNLAAWTLEVVDRGHARGAVLSPFSTPRYSTGYKQSARDTVRRLRERGAEVWLDPETHALQMPAVGDFRYYDDWPLWAGPRGQLDSEADMRGHVDHVFQVQDDLGLPHLAPTILLHSPQSTTSQNALRLAQAATDVDPECRLAVAGDGSFWAGGITLDAHIGALAQLEPAGWWVTVVRSLTVLPVPAIPEEVHGLCRTVRALSEDGPVHVSHGDLAGLPAIAAGAETLGTGWDPRQRLCAYGSYETRGTAGEGGQWFQQATLEGLLSLLTRSDAGVLAQQNNALATRLLPGAVPPGAKEAFLHHAEVLARIVSGLGGMAPRDAHNDLRGRYDAARQDWTTVAAALNTGSRADAWVTPLLDGHTLYGQTEGF
jgi:hypothetical protein